MCRSGGPRTDGLTAAASRPRSHLSVPLSVRRRDQRVGCWLRPNSPTEPTLRTRTTSCRRCVRNEVREVETTRVGRCSYKDGHLSQLLTKNQRAAKPAVSKIPERSPVPTESTHSWLCQRFPSFGQSQKAGLAWMICQLSLLINAQLLASSYTHPIFLCPLLP